MGEKVQQGEISDELLQHEFHACKSIMMREQWCENMKKLRDDVKKFPGFLMKESSSEETQKLVGRSNRSRRGKNPCLKHLFKERALPR